MPLSPGARVGRYEIGTLLEAGGMGDVYRARDLDLGRDVALKVPQQNWQNDSHFRARFKREARAVAALNHPNVVTVHDFGEVPGGSLFIAFEFIPGETLERRLERGRLSVAQAVHFALQIAGGLAHAHEAGVIHRDLKPRNVMVTGDDRLKILDFGLGKFTDSATAIAEVATTITDITRTGVLMGTVGYMSPEQVRNEVVTEASDQFVFGAVLHEMLTGRRAFQRESPVQTLSAIIEDEPDPIAALAPRTPASLARVVSRCLAKRPEERYGTTRQLLEELEAVERSLGDDPRAIADWWPKRTTVIGAVALAALAASGLYSAVTLWTTASGVSSRIVTLTVLPIASSSDDAMERAYWHGLTEAVTTRLGMLPASLELHVTPAADVKARQVQTAIDARQELGASHVIRGRAAKEGNQLRARLELIDVSTNRALRTTEVVASADNRDVLPNRLLDAILGVVDVPLTSVQRTQVSLPSPVAGANDFYLQGLGYLQDEGRADNVDAAISLFAHALELDPKFASAYAGLGEAYWRKYLSSREANWAETARETCERALGVDEQQSAPHRCLGTVANGLGNYEKALEEFQHALAREPDSELALIGLATAFEKLGLASRTEETYLKAISVRPRYWNGYSRLGAFYYTQRRYADAERLFRQVVTLNPDSWRGYSNLGALLYVQGRADDAVAAYQKSLAIRPNYQAASNLGTLYFFELGDYNRASDSFRQAVTLDDDEYVVWGNLGSSLFWAGKRDEARAAYAKAAELAEKRVAVNARDANVTMSLAEYRAELGDLDQAHRLMEKALSLAPSDAGLMFRAGVLYEHNLHDREKSLEWLGRALEAGYQWKEVEQSPALASLRQDRRLEQLRQRATASERGAKKEV